MELGTEVELSIYSEDFLKFSPLFNISEIKNVLISGFGYFLFENSKKVKIGFRNDKGLDLLLPKDLFIKLISSTLFEKLKDFCLKRREDNFLTNNKQPLKRFFVIAGFIFSFVFCSIYFTFSKILLVRIVCFYIFTRLLFLIYALFHVEKKEKDNTAIKEKELPIYSIVIALYKEPKILNQLVTAISKINYPKEKLDVIFAIEDDDIKTKEAFSEINLPHYMTVIPVPYFHPRTKPKALNYVINFTTGDYISIYDAEDIMDPEQINIALAKFAENKNFGALQGTLLFYNFKQNILTKLFYFEYWTWFQFSMYSIANIVNYIPLGGSTNHFKRRALFEVNCWDSFNVTEDLEISLRLFEKGYLLGLIDSVTEEQCVYTIKSWIKQRIRWQKGYLITYLTYFNKSFSNFNLVYFLIFHSVIGFSWIVFIITPVLFFSFNFFSHILYGIYVLILFGIISFLSLKFSLFRFFELIKVLISYPFYFLMHSCAAYLMIFDAIFRPSYWSKTNHDKIK